MNRKTIGKYSIYENYLNMNWNSFRVMTPNDCSSLRSLVVHLLIFLSFICTLQEVATTVAFDYVPQPEFVEKSADLEVTSYINQTTRLPCTIRHLGNKRVSWIRGRDLQVLSSGRTTFATDIRISILPGVTNNKKKYERKRSISRPKRTPSSYSPSYFYKSQSDDTWTSLGRKRHRMDRTSYLPNEYLGYELKQLNDTISAKFYSGLHFPYKEAMANAKYHQMYRKQTDLPEITTVGSSIFIHPSSANPKQTKPNRRTIISYNYLDEIWDPEDYTLQVKFTKRSDSGSYICQVNTDPRLTQTIKLKVVDMVAKIAGHKELFVKEGSPVALNCKVIHGKNLPGFIFWFKERSLVDYASSGGRIQVDTAPNGRSKLVLLKVKREDSGNYTCSPAGGKSASTVLTVIEDERPAAMQKGVSISAVSPCVNFITILLLCLLMTSLAHLLSSVQPLQYHRSL